jgi:hypothetical protein
MATALVIHAPEDALPARALAEKLRAAKLTVVLEKASGEEVREAARGAQVAVALWSPRSVTQPAIVDDVAAVRAKTKILHAQMQNAQTPEQFRGDKSVNLTGWRGEDEFPPWRDLAKLVTDRAGVAPLAPPAPRPPSGFFEPGRVDPATGERTPAQPRAPRPAASRTPPPRQGGSEAADAGFPDAEPKRGGMGLVLGHRCSRHRFGRRRGRLHVVAAKPVQSRECGLRSDRPQRPRGAAGLHRRQFRRR